MSATNNLAQALKSLHQVRQKPLLLANVYDTVSARAIAELPSFPVLGTASYAIAKAAGTIDDDLTLDINLASVQGIAGVAKEFGKPLTVDIQDGYGEQLEEAIGKLLDLGVVGVNIEDYDKSTRQLYNADVATERIQHVLDVARKRNVPDFVVNARCDVLVKGGFIEEVIYRGKKYLEAGATTVFVWEGSGGVSRREVERMVESFGGKLNVMFKGGPDGLTYGQLAEIGISRISVGPLLQSVAVKAIQDTAQNLLN